MPQYREASSTATMDPDLQAIHSAFERYPPNEDDRSFVDMFVVPNVTSANVTEVLKILSQHPGLNKIFWSLVNDAPTTDEGWTKVMFIGSGMSDQELQDRHRAWHRRAVEAARATLGPVQTRKDSLFRSRS
jgi:hypothetical protein